MNRSVFIVAIAGLAGAAHGQASLDVLIDGLPYVEYDEGSIPASVLVTVTLNRNGSTDGYFNSFQAWSQFAGTLRTNIGTWVQPVEGADFTETQANDWRGRRPPAFPVPGGSGGGFRYPGANQGVGVANGQVISGIAGIAQSAALGGFSQDTSQSIEVYRATLDMTGAVFAGDTVTFEPSLIQVFISSYNIERAVLNEMIINPACVFIPAPSAGALLAGAGLFGTRRNRKA